MWELKSKRSKFSDDKQQEKSNSNYIGNIKPRGKKQQLRAFMLSNIVTWKHFNLYSFTGEFKTRVDFWMEKWKGKWRMDGPGFYCFQWGVISQWGHFLTSKRSSELPQSALVVITWCFLQETLISTCSTFQLHKPAMKKSPGLSDYLWAWTLLLSTLTGRRWGHYFKTAWEFL